MRRPPVQCSQSAKPVGLTRFQGGTLGYGSRFAVAGGAVAVIYMATTAGLADGFGVPFQSALALAFAAAVAAHFFLQRYFVWRHRRGFALSVRSQLARYVMVSGTQYASTVGVTLWLPSLLEVRTTIVYLGWTAIISAITFIVFGRGIFHASAQGVGTPPSRSPH